jgi:hypothetical protein
MRRPLALIWRGYLFLRFPKDVREAHRHSDHHRAEILASRSCGCFHCGAIFPPTRIEDWTDEPDEGAEGEEQTAICPECGIDSVIGDESGFPITAAFLSRMRRHWFAQL